MVQDEERIRRVSAEVSNAIAAWDEFIAEHKRLSEKRERILAPGVR